MRLVRDSGMSSWGLERGSQTALEWVMQRLGHVAGDEDEGSVRLDKFEMVCVKGEGVWKPV